MLSINRILVPIDFSDRSTAAAEHAVLIANHFHSELIFVHVIPLSPYHYAAFESGYYTGAAWPSEAEMETTLRRQLSELVENVSSERPVEEVVVKGDPAKKIEELARLKEADLVMLPTHGYGPFRRFVLGSVTTKVLHDVKCAVFTGAHVPEVDIFSEKPYKRIACAVDLREHSETVLRWAWGFAQAWEADLVAIHAAPALDTMPADGRYFTVKLREMLNNAMQEEIEALLGRVGCEAKVYVDSEETTYFVPEAVRDSGANLLVIGRGAQNGVLGRLRTHAYALIRESPCPVISV